MHARIGMLRAMNFGKPVEKEPRRKAVKKFTLLTNEKAASIPKDTGG